MVVVRGIGIILFAVVSVTEKERIVEHQQSIIIQRHSQPYWHSQPDV